jgi:hypothetical protein
MLFKEVTIGEPASISRVTFQAVGFFGFILGYKVVYGILNYSAFVDDPQGYFINQNLVTGIALAALFAYMAYREQQKQVYLSQKISETVHPYQNGRTI